MDKQSQIRGTLWGLAYGDVLGCPVETWSEDSIMQVYGHFGSFPKNYNYNRIKNLSKSMLYRLRPLGLHSDDTQQALALLNVCLSKGGWSKAKWADILVNGAKNGAWRGTGPRFRDAVMAMSRRLEQNESPEGVGSKSAGIGAAMRTSVVGGLCSDNQNDLKKVVLESTVMTHADIRAMSIAYAVAYVNYLLINGEAVNNIRHMLVEHLPVIEREICEDYVLDIQNMHAVSDGFRHILESGAATIPDLRRAIAIYARIKLGSSHALHPNDGFVLLGGLHAVFIALLDKVDPTETLFDIIRLGDDTDTVAAIAGGIFGARFGDEWIEKSIITDNAKIGKYADAMVTGKSAETMCDLINREKNLTETEREFRLKNEQQFS